MISENETLQSHSKDPGLVHSWLTFIRPMDEWSELTSPSHFGPSIICLLLLQHMCLSSRDKQRHWKTIKLRKKSIELLLDWHNLIELINRPFFHWLYIELDPDRLPGKQTFPNKKRMLASLPDPV